MRDRRLIIALAICLTVAVLGIVAPTLFATTIVDGIASIVAAFDWAFLAVTSALLVLCGWLALGRHGRRRLGDPDTRPAFSTFAWISMLFAAGMGSGLMFWGVAEPLAHVAAPPITTDDARSLALGISAYHWGFHAWAIYAIATLVLAYFRFCRGTDYRPGSALRAALPGRVGEIAGDVADFTGVLAVAFGVAGTVGMGVMQLRSGLWVAFAVDAGGAAFTVAIVVLLVAAYTASAVTRIERGIKWLSNINVVVALGFMAALMLATGVLDRLGDAIAALASYARIIVPLSTMTGPWSAATDWVHGWTVSYLVWWIAWAPFVGVFVARISRGRTVRELMVAVILVPSLLSVVWFAALGGAAIALDRDGGLSAIAISDPPGSLFATLALSPAPTLLCVIALALMFLFLVTSVDSAAYVLGMITTGGADDPPAGRKLLWGLVLGVICLGPVLTGRVDVVKGIALVGAIPFTLVLVLQTWALLRALGRERAG